MNRAVIVRTLRDALPLILTTVVVVVLFEMLFLLAMNQLAPDLLAFVSRLKFLIPLFKALLSLDVASNVTFDSLAAIGMVHPFFLAVTWSVLVTLGTRVPAGEIDRGTADVLLTLPISRTAIALSVWGVWIGTAALFCLSAWTGSRLGQAVFHMTAPLDFSGLALVATNLFVLELAIGGTTALASAICNRRGTAIALVIGLLLFSILIDFLAAFLESARPFRFLGFLEYYRPVEIVRDHRIEPRNLVVLLSIALSTWTAALWVFRRKDVPGP